MASVGVGIFNTWLSEKLLQLNSDVDLDVFVSYITGILETETTRDDKSESLVGIIGEILPDNNIAEHCDEIIDKWAELTDNCNELKSESGSSSLDAAIHKMIEKQTTTAVNRPQQTSSNDEHCKKVILAQYANVSDGEDSDGGGDTVHTKPAAAAAATPSTSDLLVKNMNALKVKERALEERNQAKQQSDAKRQKDKEDREKQKQKTQDRKENEKKRTQKGEKKR